MFLCIAVLLVGESQAYASVPQNILGFNINSFFNYFSIMASYLQFSLSASFTFYIF